jgi:protein gp37
MKEEWAVSIMNQAEEHEAAFFFKQWGSWGSDGVKRSKKNNGKLLMRRVCQAMPKDSLR